MRIIEVAERGDFLVNQLLALWENCVRETHLFLPPNEILAIKPDAKSAIESIPHLIVLENESANPAAFMGVAEQKIEMLFVRKRGVGYGRKLLEYAITHFGANEVAVNEQNKSAVGFYQHLGFKTYKRSALDEQGRAYPLLYMRLDSQKREQNEKMV